jgi:hypothetical protein
VEGAVESSLIVFGLGVLIGGSKRVRGVNGILVFSVAPGRRGEFSGSIVGIVGWDGAVLNGVSVGSDITQMLECRVEELG